MWLEYLGDYILFLAEVVTVLVAILMVISSIAALSQKAREKGQLTIKSLNRHFEQVHQRMQAEVCTRAEIKKQRRQARQQARQQRHATRKRVFVLDFKGDMYASQVESLREEISALLTMVTAEDEVVLRLESPGGVVHGYGLAASELMRLRQHNIPLTIAVDKVAASGGYMMAVTAQKILAAPFAVIGSVGVVAQLPNFHRWLSEHGIDVELHTAGKYKRTLTLLGKNTDEGREKFQEDLENVHSQFKEHIQACRTDIDIEQLATGEHWLGQQACQRGLVDGIATSDDYLWQRYQQGDTSLFSVHYEIRRKMLGRLKTQVARLLTPRSIPGVA